MALAVCVDAGVALSAVLHHLFRFAEVFTLASPLVVILVAQQVLVAKVASAKSRKTTAGRSTALVYFGIFLCALIAPYGYALSLAGLHDGVCSCETHDLGTALFFSVVTWTTVGYGDVTATVPIARLLAAVEALNGYRVLALFIAALVPVFQRLLQGVVPGDGPEQPPSK